MIVRKPTAKILECCDALDGAIQRIIDAVAKYGARFGHHEAPVEARNLLVLAIRVCEGIITLARNDLVLAPGALALARAVFETCLRARWLLWPSDPFEQEARWLTHLGDEGHLWDRIARIASETGGKPTLFRKAAKDLEDFRLAVAAKLPTSVDPPARLPTVEAALTEQNERKYYVTYALLSQYVHGTHFAGGIFRKGLGTDKELGERTHPTDWAHVLQASWWSLYPTAVRVVEAVGGNPIELGSQQETAGVTRVLEELRVQSASTSAPSG